MNPSLIENNFIHLPGFISIDRANQYATQFKEFSKAKNLLGDHQVENSHSKYNYNSFLKLLLEKIPEVSSLSGEEVLPICCYSRVYRNGNVLKRHRDREACEISLTVNLSGDTMWPFGIQKPNNENVLIQLSPGDAIMYLGFRADHWREAYQGNEYVQVFLHYVASKGPYSNFYIEFTNWILREIIPT